MVACEAPPPPPTAVPAVATNPTTAQTVILFVGDGVDDHQLTIGRNYLLGSDGAFSFEEFPNRGAAAVLTVLERDPAIPEYVADSGSGATAMASGVVTSRGRIATRAGTGEPVETVIERAVAAGKRAGLVTTSSLTDATPASFFAHVRSRSCQGPSDMRDAAGNPRCPEALKANGGEGSIAEQLVGSQIDVLLGGGYARFAQTDEAGEAVMRSAETAGYEVVRNQAQLEDVSLRHTRRVLGLFGDDTLPVAWIGENGQRAQRVRLTPDGHPIAPASFGCVDNPQFGDRPTLEAMTTKALELLEPAPEGFFLMVESASIDKRAHAGDPCGEIGEIRALDQAVRAAVDYQERHPDTLIVVASDHGQAAQIIPWPSLFASRAGVPQYPPGRLALVRTPQQGTMAVTYGTNVNNIEEHTGTQIPVFAQGPGAAAVQGLIRQSDLFGIMMRAMGLESARPHH
jgi:alkaline phosphatase